MRIYGLIGHSLGHSYSAVWFAQKFEREGITDCEYRLFELRSIEELPALLVAIPELRGFNVTIPYKETILPCLDELSPEAVAVGAVNCVVYDSGRLIGYNTDIEGFRSMLDHSGISSSQPVIDGFSLRPPAAVPAQHSALVLGTGGASKAVQYVLTERGIPCRTVSRTAGKGDLTYAQITDNIIASNNLLINTSPVGMFPHIDEIPAIPYEAITPAHRLIDLIYNPAQTRFLQSGAARGAATQNGMEMLYAQAEAAYKIMLNAEF